jgi:DtxR family Mn-dependent transcriptional regulator
MKHEGDESAHVVCGRGYRLARPDLLARMRALGILEPGPEVAFSKAGLRRAENLIRRQRLAEILFSQTFQMHEELVEEEACYFEHVLSPAMTDSICSFLGHPETCPHGKPIPRGACCAAASKEHAVHRPVSE